MRLTEFMIAYVVNKIDLSSIQFTINLTLIRKIMPQLCKGKFRFQIKNRNKNIELFFGFMGLLHIFVDVCTLVGTYLVKKFTSHIKR